MNSRQLFPLSIALGESFCKDFLAQVELSSSSVAQTLQSLIEKDWIYRDADGTLRLLDPVMSYFLSRIKP